MIRFCRVSKHPLDAIDPAARIQRMLANWRLVRLRVARSGTRGMRGMRAVTYAGYGMGLAR